MIEREFYPLSIAAGIVGYSEDDLIHLGRTGKLKFYIDPANWAKREFNNPVTSNIINVPILIDDPIYLSKLDRGLESIMCFSEQYPDCLLEDLDAIKSEVMGDNPNEFLDPELGIPMTRDRLVIMAISLSILNQPSIIVDIHQTQDVQNIKRMNKFASIVEEIFSSKIYIKNTFAFFFIGENTFHLEDNGLFKPRKLTRYQHQKPRNSGQKTKSIPSQPKLACWFLH